MPHVSSPELLVLHAVRVKGMADAATVAGRFELDPELVDELLLDYEAFGWISRVRFADIEGWALTPRGRAEDERRLTAELDHTGTRSDVVAAHDAFVVLNSRFLATITDWQIRPEPADPLAANDHSDTRWDERVLDDLRDLHSELRPVSEQLGAAQVRRIQRAILGSFGQSLPRRTSLDLATGYRLLPYSLDGAPRGPAGNARSRARLLAVVGARTPHRDPIVQTPHLRFGNTKSIGSA